MDNMNQPLLISDVSVQLTKNDEEKKFSVVELSDSELGCVAGGPGIQNES